MMNTKSFLLAFAIAWAGLAATPSQAQVTYSEDFTGTSTTNNWYFFNGACLTAGSGTGTSSPGNIPGCRTVLSSYYHSAQDGDNYLSGGSLGYLGSATQPSGISSQVADATGSGALRFTNGYPLGHQERGAILSADTFSTG